jgi:hypothetical protein
VTLPRWERLLHTLAQRKFPRERSPDPGLATQSQRR